MSRRALFVDLALALWLLVTGVVYLRQFTGPALQLLPVLFGR